MPKIPKSSLKKFAGTVFFATLSAATGGLVNEEIVGVGEKMAAAIASHFAINGTKDLYNFLKDTHKQEDELNHDLRRGLQQATEAAIREIVRVYKKEENLNKHTQQQIQQFAKNLIQAVKELQPPFSDNFKQTFEPIYALEKAEETINFSDYLSTELESIGLVDEEFQQLFLEHFQNLITLYFAEILKSDKPEDVKVWKAYEKMALESLQNSHLITHEKLDAIFIELRKKEEKLDDIFNGLAEQDKKLEDISKDLTKQDANLGGISKDLATKDEKLAAISKHLKLHIESVLQSLQYRMRKVIENLRSMEEVFAELKSDVKGIDKKADVIGEDVKEVKSGVKGIDKKADVIGEDVKDIKDDLTDIKETKTDVKELKTDVKEIKEAINIPKIPIHLGTSVHTPDIFMGRDVDMEAVHRKLFSGENVLLLVNGVGGIGKTTLAAQYYHTYTKQYAHLAWVFADKSLLDALLTLAPKLHLTFPQEMSNEQRLELLLQALRELDKPSLLVIDNANKLSDLEQNYTKLRSCPNFHILLTTRITEFEQADIYRIHALAEADAMALFKRLYPMHKTTEDELLKGILKAVEYNTLVLTLLAKNLYRFNRLKINYSLHDLLHDLQNKGLLALSKSRAVQTDYKNLKKAKPEVIISAMYDLGELSEQENAILSVLSVLPAENIAFEVLQELLVTKSETSNMITSLLERLGVDTPSEFFKTEILEKENIDIVYFDGFLKLFTVQSKFKNLDETLLDITQKGWLEYSEETASFKISPVIQEVTREKQSNLLDNCQQLIISLIDKLDHEQGIGHFKNVSYEKATLLARYTESVVDSLKTPNHAIAILCERLGNFHRTVGNLDKALSYFTGEVAFLEKLYVNFPSTLAIKNSLARAYQWVGGISLMYGNLDKALLYFEEFNNLMKKLRIAYPDNVGFKKGFGISCEKLAETYVKLNDFCRALSFFEDEKALFEELYTAYPLNVEFKTSLGISYQKLGEVHIILGNLEKALEFFEKSYQLIKELYAAYPNNVRFKTGLGISYQKLGEVHIILGNLEKALEFFEKSYQLIKELYAAYPDSVDIKNYLAVCYSKLWEIHSILGNLEKAKINLEQCFLLWSELVADFPAYVEFQQNLDLVKDKLKS